MMLYPPMADLVDKVGSRYLLVNLVAKRARALSVEAEAKGETLNKKTVSAAIDEVYTGKLSINNELVSDAEPVIEEDPAPCEGDNGDGSSVSCPTQDR